VSAGPLLRLFGLTAATSGCARPLFLAAALLLALGARRAAAHAELLSAEPAPGQTVRESPGEIRLTFNEPIGPGGAIMLLTASFEEIRGLSTTVDGRYPAQLVSVLPAGVLEPGVYTVQWFVTGVDGHPASGSYSFAVGDGGASPGVAFAFALLLLVAVALLAWLAVRLRRTDLT
jgi:methionine-rich copper-binding protein CopC